MFARTDPHRAARRRVIAAALGVVTGIGAAAVDATATAAGEPVCLDVGPVTYIPAPGADPVTVPGCPSPAPAASVTQEQAPRPQRRGLYRPPEERWGGRGSGASTSAPEPRPSRRGLYRPPSERWGGR